MHCLVRWIANIYYTPGGGKDVPCDKCLSTPEEDPKIVITPSRLRLCTNLIGAELTLVVKLWVLWLSIGSHCSLWLGCRWQCVTSHIVCINWDKLLATNRQPENEASYDYELVDAFTVPRWGQNLRHHSQRWVSLLPGVQWPLVIWMVVILLLWLTDSVSVTRLKCGHLCTEYPWYSLSPPSLWVQ